ncbi:MAG: hypothetical protein CMI54_02480 [Parcubacteria group bacterium]|jgi:hypothetical protein|nr:hypothetical protein [Parcubacteria group bacterium]|tara:strand:+ start:11143 stop:11646 length:504 start_codon:yes stop_codon:yes gene_type:complete
MRTSDDVKASYACKHEITELKKRINSNKAECFLYQCLNCGKGLDTVKKYTISQLERDSVKLFDYSLIEANDKKRQNAWKEYHDEKDLEQQSKNQEWWKSYNEYLQTPKWKAKRLSVLNRDNYICQGCLKNQAKQAHHLTYDHVGDELLFELVSICEECHIRIHFKKE